MIYFIAHRESDMVKIGHSKNPERRFRTLQSTSPVALELLGSMVGSCQMERKLHTYFFPVHVRDEWFRLSMVEPEVIEMLAGTFDMSRLPAEAVRAWALAARVDGSGKARNGRTKRTFHIPHTAFGSGRVKHTLTIPLSCRFSSGSVSGSPIGSLAGANVNERIGQ